SLGGRQYGLVTVDVEPDNVWQNPGSASFDNFRALPGFHALCQEYGVRPTYLVTYSAAMDPLAARVVEQLLDSGGCEVGAHPHLWETPPLRPGDEGVPKVG